MAKADHRPKRFQSISELHNMLGFPKPLHPLVSLVDYADIKATADELPKALLLDFYKISYKKNLKGKIGYGQNHYDFDEGGLSFVSPNQIISAIPDEHDYSGHTLLIHPDFIRPYALGKRIGTFGFFSYSVREALFLSDKEKRLVFSVFDNIQEELSGNIDDFSQDLVVSYIEVLLNYANRFYNRQFLTRKAVNHDLLTRMEDLLDKRFDGSENKLPTVEELAAKLNLSPRYLSDMLRSLTGKGTQQHIHDKMIFKAMEFLGATDLSVAQIAYQLGFDHPQSFNRIFKTKTKATPLEFRQSLQQN